MTAAAGQQMLFIDGYPPMPDRNSGGLRTIEILKLLVADGHDVTFLAQDVLDESGPYLTALERLGVTALVAPPGRGAAGYLPPNVTNQQFDTIIIAFYTTATVYLPACRKAFAGARIVIDTIDLHYLREQRHAEVVADAAKAAKAETTRRKELAIYDQADALWAITPVEQAILRSETSVADVAIVPNIHDVKPPMNGFNDRNGLVFVGNFWHPPNTEGLVWFCYDVLPIIRQQIPDITTTVIGANVKPEYFAEFESQGVRLAGWVPDLHDALETARVSIAPLLHGAGMKGKVGEALGVGLPVVTTPIGSEGMGLSNGVNVLVAGNAVDFAAHVVRAHTNAQLWQSLSENGLGFMKANYTPEAMSAVVRSAVLPPKAARFLGVPDWSNEFIVKSVVDAYVRRYSDKAAVSLCLAVVQHDVNAAADSLTRWIAELGHDVEKIPDIELQPMTGAELFAASTDTVWIPMGTRKPDHLQKIGSFFPAHGF